MQPENLFAPIACALHQARREASTGRSGHADRSESAVATLGLACGRTSFYDPLRSRQSIFARNAAKRFMAVRPRWQYPAAFVGAGFSADTALSIAARVIGWRDADDVAGPEGAEEADYHAAGLHYGPRNAPFQSVEELRQVLGMDTLRGSVLGRFTVYTHQGDDDISGFAEDLDASTSTGAPSCAGTQGGGPLTGFSGQDSLIGEAGRIRACASGRVRVCRLVVARLTGSLHSPFQVFIWRAEGAED
jgi:hypothetical protein